MAGEGRRVTFHGAFKTKAKALRRERARPGSFVRRFNMRRLGVRFVVMKER
jgi:hypothetical protein